jgi:RNA polymerase sigma-70 factor (ECF subfamily)
LLGDAPKTAATVETPKLTVAELWYRVCSCEDEEAFETLFYEPPYRFWGRARGYMRHVFSLGDIAEDLATDAVVKAFRSRKNFRSESRFETWFWTIVRNTALDHLNSAMHQREVPLPNDAPESIVDRRAGKELDRVLGTVFLDQMLECPQLSPTDLQVLILSLEGLEAEEIAEVMGVTVARMYQLRSHAIATLRAYLLSLTSWNVSQPAVGPADDSRTQFGGEV